MEKQDYRPVNIEFDVANNTIVPDNLGEFKDSKEAFEFLHKNTTALNHGLTAVRFMDSFEKKELRKDCHELNETSIPMFEKDLQKATSEYEKAKKEQKNATEQVNARINELRALGVEIKRGVREMPLDEQFTFRLPFDGQYFFYTFIDLQLKLCRIQDIPQYEKEDLFNAMSVNEEFFNENFGTEEVEDLDEKDE